MKIKKTLLMYSILSLLSVCFFSNAEAQRKKPAKAKPAELKIPSKVAEIVSVELDTNKVIQICPFYEERLKGIVKPPIVKITTVTKNFENEGLEIYYTVSGGKIVGSGSNVVWDLSKSRVGEYTLTVGIGKDNRIFGTQITKRVSLLESSECDPPCSCYRTEIEGPVGVVKRGELVVFSTKYIDSSAIKHKIVWKVIGGEIINGENSSQVLVKVTSDSSISELSVTVMILGNDICFECIEETQIRFIDDR
jgi:hypothetical protein